MRIGSARLLIAWKDSVLVTLEDSSLITVFIVSRFIFHKLGEGIVAGEAFNLVIMNAFI